MATESDFGYRAFDLEVREDTVPLVAARTWVQHLVVFAVRREMAGGATTTKALAALLDQTETNVGRKLSGAGNMTFDDLVKLAVAFGPEILPSVSSRIDLFPPAYRDRLKWDRANGMASPRLRDGATGVPDKPA